MDGSWLPSRASVLVAIGCCFEVIVVVFMCLCIRPPESYVRPVYASMGYHPRVKKKRGENIIPGTLF